MRATYCPTCDETRWQITGLAVQRATACPACGTDMHPERRQPGRGPLTGALVERRSALGDRPAGATRAGATPA